MNALSEFLLPWLADFFLLATLLLIGVLLACWRIAQPARRQALARYSLLALLLLACLCAIPGWSIVHILSAEAPIADATQDYTEAIQPSRQLPSLQLVPSEFNNSPQVKTTTEIAIAETSTTEIPIEQPMSALAWLVLSYLNGCCLVLLWQVCGSILARRLIHRAIPASHQLQLLLENITTDAQSTPTLLISDLTRTPAALGLHRPIILLPADMTNHERETLLPILAHEWAHIENGDLRTLPIVRLLTILIWPHPLYFLLRRQMRLDQEALADATAAELTTRADYAEQLVALARQSQPTHLPRLAASVGLWESASQLRRRVALLLDDRLTILRRCSRRWRIGSALGLFTIAAGLSLVTLTPSEQLQAEDPPQTTEKPTEIKTGFRHAVPIADTQEKQNEKSTAISNFIPATPIADSDDKTNNNNVKFSATPTITDEEKGKLMRLHYKQLRDERQPNTIIGLCIDEKGRPLEGVLVEVFASRIRSKVQNDKPILSTRSNAKGEYRFEKVIDIEQEFPEGLPDHNFDINPKVITIIGRSKGRVPGFDRDLITSLVKHGKTNVWLMQPAHALRGRVTDEQGQPVAGAVVKAGMYGPMTGLSIINTAFTDAEGNYEITDLAAFDAEEQRRKEAAYRKANPTQPIYADLRSKVFIQHPQYASKHALVENIPGKVDAQLVPGSTIEGAIQFPKNSGDIESIAGGNVHLYRVMPQPAAGTPLPYQTENTTLDESGRYRFDSLPAGKYNIFANVEGWVTPGIENVEVKKGEIKTAPNIMYTKGGRIRVQLVDDKTGQPMTFNKPTKGFISPIPRPQRPTHFYQYNFVEFSTEGIAERQVLPGRYAIYASILSDKGPEITSMPDGKVEEWPTQKVAEGEVLEITARMRERKLAEGEVKWTVTGPASPPSDEAGDEKLNPKEKTALEAITKLGGNHTFDPESKGRITHYVVIGSEWKGELDGLKHLEAITMPYILSFYSAPLDATVIDTLLNLDLKTVKRFEFYGSPQPSQEAIETLGEQYPNAQVAVRSAARLGIQGEFGTTKVLRVVKGSAADKAGLKEGDVITEFNGEEVEDFAELIHRIAKQQPGETVTLTVNRDRETLEIEATLDSWGSDRAQFWLPPDNRTKEKPKTKKTNWSIQGRVTNTNGVGLANVKIRASTGYGTLTGGNSTFTDEEGRYQLHFGPGMRQQVSDHAPLGVGIQAASIFASKSGWFELNLCRQGDLLMSDQTEEELAKVKKLWGEKDVDDVIFANQPREVNFQLAPAATIEGAFVETSHNWNVREQKIYIVGPELPPSSSVLESLTTDKKGKFVVDSLPVGFEWRFGIRIPNTGLEIETKPFRLDQPGKFECRLVLEADQESQEQVQLGLRILDMKPWLE